jgi:hypothetical protein
MKNLEELIKDVERDLLVNILVSLKHKRMTKAQSIKLSKLFLTGFPIKDFESLFSALSTLSRDYSEARKVYVKHAVNYFDFKDKEKLENMRFYIGKKDYEKAILTGKGQRSIRGLGPEGGES